MQAGRRYSGVIREGRRVHVGGLDARIALVAPQLRHGLRSTLQRKTGSAPEFDGVVDGGWEWASSFATLCGLRNSDWTKILGWPGYRVYRSEIDEDAKTLKLWVRRKLGKLVCFGCGRTVAEIAEINEREVRDLSCFEYRTTIRGRVVPSALPGLRGQGRDNRAVAQQSSVQQTVRGRRG